MMQRFKVLSLGASMALASLAGCGSLNADMEPFNVQSDAGAQLGVTPMAAFDQPWAMTFLPDGRMLVTEKPGRLLLVSEQGDTLAEVTGLPPITASGQGGLGDVILHPQFENNARVYVSYVERDGSSSGAAVAMARLSDVEEADGLTPTPALEEFEVIWRQQPKTSGSGHYGHRLAFSPDGDLFITSGERQKFTPAQDLDQNLGKLIRLREDGTVPPDNPFAGQGRFGDEIWSMGHRNPLGISFDADGVLWVHEMGPRGGDELNRIVGGNNYGYPLVSEGDHYDGEPIPDHDTAPQFAAPAISWNPVISPAGLVIYPRDSAEKPFAAWAGNALIGGLSSEALIRVSLAENDVREVERFAMPARIREVELHTDGTVYLLEDADGGRLLRLRAVE